MYAIGEVVRALADKLKFKETGGFKYHLCVCNQNRLYFWLCSKPRKYDFQITDKDCPNLPKEVSYVSLSSKLHVPDERMRRAKPQSIGIATDDFMRAYLDYLRAVPALADDERELILAGIKRRWNNE